MALDSTGQVYVSGYSQSTGIATTGAYQTTLSGTQDALVAQLSTPSEDERKKIEGQLQELAKELVDLDVQELELRAEELDKELGEVKDELAKMRDNLDKQTKERYEMLLEKVKKRKK